MKAFRKKLLEGTEIEWRGEKVLAKTGSEMDVEKYREQQRSKANGRRESQNENELGRKLVIKNLKTEVQGDAVLEGRLQALCEAYCKGSELEQFQVMQAKSGKSAFAWVCYSTVEEAEGALTGNGLREDITDSGGLAWSTAYVSMKVPLAREHVGATQELSQNSSIWYAAPMAVRDAVPTLQLDNSGSALQGLWDAALKSGSLARAFGEVVDAKLDRVMSRVEQALEDMMNLRAGDAERIERLERDGKEAGKQRREDNKKAQSLQAKTNELLAKLMEQQEGRNQTPKANRASRGRKREVESEDEDDDMGEEEEEMPVTAKKVKGARAAAQEKELSHSLILATLLGGLGMENVQQLSTLGVPSAQVDKLVKELGLNRAK